MGNFSVCTFALNEKVDAFARTTGKFKDYTVSQKGLSMTDMQQDTMGVIVLLHPSSRSELRLIFGENTDYLTA